MTTNDSDLDFDVLLVGGGIMSATVGTLLAELDPTLRIGMLARLDHVEAAAGNVRDELVEMSAPVALGDLAAGVQDPGDLPVVGNRVAAEVAEVVAMLSQGRLGLALATSALH